VGERPAELARRLETGTEAIMAALAGRPDDDARILAHHLATSHALALSLAQAVVNREPLPSISWAMMHEINLQHVNANTTVGLADALELLRTTTAATAEAIRQLSDEQLAATASWGLGAENAAVSARTVIEKRLIGHAEAHLTELHATSGET
jgi:hypothetical protein